MANPTTNYGFVLPTPTDLVTDLPADFDVALQGVDTRLKALQPGTTLGDLAFSSATPNTNTRIGIGSSGQVLSVVAGVPAWANDPDQTPLTTKGDLLGFSTLDARIPIGANNTVLTADSAQGLGLKWAAPTGSTAVGVTAFTSTAQNTTSSTATVINLNSEAFDTDSMHSTATNTSRLTIPSGKGGYYLVNVLTVIDATGNDVFITILKNGSAITGYGQWNNNRMAASNYGGAGYVVAWGSQTYPLSAGDYIEVTVQCAKATGANCLHMTFSAMYLGA